ncbi:MAG: hypothetical protein AAF587_20215 [Bacteroidota bacterium]
MDLRIKQLDTTSPLRVLILEERPEETVFIFKALQQVQHPAHLKSVETKQAFIRQLYQFVPQVILSGPTFDTTSIEDALVFVRRMFPDIPFILLACPGQICQEDQVNLLGLGITEILDKSRLDHLPKVLEKSRSLFADPGCESQLIQLRVMSQIRKNIEGLKKIQSYLGGQSPTGEDSLSEAILNELESSISHLQNLGNNLRNKQVKHLLHD